MQIKTRRDRLQQKMADMNIAALVVPSADPHQSEYVAEHWQARKWLTGFTGSAGTAVVTRDGAGLWTDFRYWIQAQAQLKGSGFDLFRMGEDQVPGFETWLTQVLSPGDVIAVAGDSLSRSQLKKYEEKWGRHGLSVTTDHDLVAEIWTDRPPMPGGRAWDFSVDYAGLGRREKLAALRKKMMDQGADHYLITTLEDIAWTFNLRGSDVHTNPVNIAFALVDMDGAVLFIAPEKVGDDLGALLLADGVVCLPYDEVDRSLAALAPESTVLMDPAQVNVRLWNALAETCTRVETSKAPATELKAVKNDVEAEHLRQTLVKDGVAMVSFLHWLESRVRSGKTVTEMEAGERVKEFRRVQEGFVDNSFDPIMAQGEHSAMCHYSAGPDTNVPISPDSLFLNDSGGHYLTGTTDITRTLCLGRPTPAQKRDYTLVLKGHIALARARFPKGTRGCQVDTLARRALWQEGLDFGHGTGHGVGFFLCVHEGPARISPFPVDVPLKPGMVLTNEPGLYREGEYGIRLENMIRVWEEIKTDFGPFLGFETLTLCHFERDMLEIGLMTPGEIQWINAYHERVYTCLAPLLDAPPAQWLKDKTRPV